MNELPTIVLLLIFSFILLVIEEYWIRENETFMLVLTVIIHFIVTIIGIGLVFS